MNRRVLQSIAADGLQVWMHCSISRVLGFILPALLGTMGWTQRPCSGAITFLVGDTQTRIVTTAEAVPNPFYPAREPGQVLGCIHN